jgi:uncharacterized protein (TIGR02001 family)
MHGENPEWCTGAKLARSLLKAFVLYSLLEFHMKNILVPSLLAASLLSVAGIAHAQAAESTLSFNAGVVSDYRYRGISQTRLQPALQGGVDYAHKSGLYVGAWGSTIKFIKDTGATFPDPGGTPGVKGSMELDLYGGYKWAAGSVAYDVGVLRYEYVRNNLQTVSGYANANTTEVYGAATYGVFTAKYSHSLTNVFGNLNSKNSYYLDLSAAFDLGNGYTLTPHIGRQMINNAPSFSYNDYSLTLAKDLGNGLTASLMAVGTNAGKNEYTLVNKYNGKDALVAGLKYTF